MKKILAVVYMFVVLIGSSTKSPQSGSTPSNALNTSTSVTTKASNTIPQSDGPQKTGVSSTPSGVLNKSTTIKSPNTTHSNAGPQKTGISSTPSGVLNKNTTIKSPNTTHANAGPHKTEVSSTSSGVLNKSIAIKSPNTTHLNAGPQKTGVSSTPSGVLNKSTTIKSLNTTHTNVDVHPTVPNGVAITPSKTTIKTSPKIITTALYVNTSTTAITMASYLAGSHVLPAAKAVTTTVMAVEEEHRVETSGVDAGSQDSKAEDSRPGITMMKPEEPSTSYFPVMFLLSILAIVGGYFLYHNRSKIMGLIIEGRLGRSPRSSPRYNRLKNVEEAMPGVRTSKTV